MHKNNIGLLLISTGNYHVFIDQLIISARKYFMNNHNVTFFLFTDSDKFTHADDIVLIPHEHKPWPLPTLYRYKTFNANKQLLFNMDYLYYCDIDMLFVDDVGDEAIGNLVSTIHPGFCGSCGTPERRPESLAYLPIGTPNTYFAGGFNGGKRDNFLQMCNIIDMNIDTDLVNNIIAVWHDESHMNNYMYFNKPDVILDPGYCYGESMLLPYVKRLLALNKNHKEIRA